MTKQTTNAQQQPSLDGPPPRPPPPLSRKGSSANEKVIQDVPLSSDEMLMPTPIDTQTVLSATDLIYKCYGKSQI